jgi:homoserine kinase
LKSAVEQWGNIAGLVAGIQNNDFSLIGRSLKDVIIEPVRSILIPKFDEIKKKPEYGSAWWRNFRIRPFCFYAD